MSSVSGTNGFKSSYIILFVKAVHGFLSVSLSPLSLPHIHLQMMTTRHQQISMILIWEVFRSWSCFAI